MLTAPNRPPGNVFWKTDGSWVTVRWDHVKALGNESAVLGYKVSGVCFEGEVCVCRWICVCHIENARSKCLKEC